MLDKVDSLVFETFVEPICTELDNVSWSFTVDSTVQFIEKIGVFSG